MMLSLKRCSAAAGLILVSLTITYSQDLAAAEAQAPDYINVLKGRADKIVNTLDIDDPEKKETVRNLIVMQYYNLSRIHDGREAQIESLKKRNERNEKIIDSEIKRIVRKSDKDVRKLHNKYIAQLSELMNASQVDKVKDGMTYGVVPVTYKGYLKLLPDLTDKEKEKIMDYLIEARELAMDAGSSEKKHYWFGQYKGKINNYLSANGYDLKEAERELKKRTEGK